MNAPAQITRIPDFPVADQFPARWSPRAFTDTTLSQSDVMTILEAARWAPSAFNAQPWRFAWALRGEGEFDAIAGSLAPFNQVWATKAAALIAIASKTKAVPPGGDAEVANPAHAFDAGAAWQSIALQANHMGLIAHAMGGIDHAKAAENLGLPADYALHVIVAIGKRGDAATLPEALQGRETPSPRLPLSQTAGHGRFTR